MHILFHLDHANFSYDHHDFLITADGMNLTRDPQNGLLQDSSLDQVTDTFIYNPFGEPEDYQASFSASSLFQQSFLRDKLGRIMRKTETVLGISRRYDYTYDLAGRLETVTVDGTLQSTYVYDANGNRLSHITVGGNISGSYDNQDRLLSYGVNTYQYTANGELVSKMNPDGETLYQYDELGNLLSVQLPDGNTLEYVIDGLNRRIGKKVNGVLVQGLLYQDNLNPVAELDGAGNVISRFVYASKLNVPDYMIRSGVRYRIISDQLGSPRLVVNAQTGAIVQRIDYDEFGNLISDSNPGFQPFGFAGGIDDRDTGLTRFGVRDYDSESGRWTAKDPIKFEGSDTNIYGYVLNNPLRWVDLTGLDITISINSDAAKGFGHVGIGVNTPDTVGQRPQENASSAATFFGLDVPGEISRDNTQTSSINLPTNPDQDRKAQQCIDTRTIQQQDYNLYSNNCAQFVRQCLNAAGINTPNTIFPEILFKTLQDSVGENQ